MSDNDTIPDEWTPEMVADEMKALARCVMRLGAVDWVALTQQDDTPAPWCQRVTTLFTAAGMLCNLGLAAQVTVDDVFMGMIAATAAGSTPTTEGATT